MKKKLSKYWFLVILIAPFFLMFCFHIGLALGAYFGISINADDISTKDWFAFAGSYLGGVMTLIYVHLKDSHQMFLFRQLIQKSKFQA